MAHDASLLDSSLSPSDPLKHSKPPLGVFVSLDIHKIRRRTAMLSDEHRITLGLKFSDDLGRLALQSGHKFGSHQVTLEWQSLWRKRRWPNAQLADGGLSGEQRVAL